MERLQLFSGKNRSCKEGLARRRQKSMLRMQQDWQQQEQQQQLQAMQEAYQQQQQQQQQMVECVDASWHMLGWQMTADWAAVPQAPAAACNSMPWGAAAAVKCGNNGQTNGGNSSSSTHSTGLPVPAVPFCGPAAAAAAPQQPADVPSYNNYYNNNNNSPQLMQHCSNAATPIAAPCAPIAVPVLSSSDLDAFLAGCIDQQAPQQGCAAAAAAPAAGCARLAVPACISDAELDAIISEELLAAGLQISSGPAGMPMVASVDMGCAQPSAAAAAAVPLPAAAAVAPMPAAAAAAAGAVGPNRESLPQQQAQAAQYAKLHALMAELDALKATLQQLQQERGEIQQVCSAATQF
jgi:hypothetical protein